MKHYENWKLKLKLKNVGIVWFEVRSRKNINHKNISFA